MMHQQPNLVQTWSLIGIFGQALQNQFIQIVVLKQNTAANFLSIFAGSYNFLQFHVRARQTEELDKHDTQTVDIRSVVKT